VEHHSTPMVRGPRLGHTGGHHSREMPTESRQESRMSVENSPLESSEYDGPQFLHVPARLCTVVPSCEARTPRFMVRICTVCRADGLASAAPGP
jgi:hypothetical protein